MPFDATPVELKPEQRVLLEAAGFVRKGWCQGEECRIDLSGQPFFCAVGAIFAATRKATTWDMAIEDSALVGQHDIGSWNDAPSRTAEEVAQALERAAL